MIGPLEWWGWGNILEYLRLFNSFEVKKLIRLHFKLLEPVFRVLNATASLLAFGVEVLHGFGELGVLRVGNW
jgi:hypothetical protein